MGKKAIKGGRDADYYALKNRPYPLRGQGRAEDLPAPAHLCCQGLGSRSHPVLQAIQVDQALPAEGYSRP